MKYIGQRLIEDAEQIPATIYPEDADSLGSAYCELKRFVETETKNFEQKARGVINTFQPFQYHHAIKIDSNINLLTKVIYVNNLEGIFRHAKVMPREEAIAYLQKTLTWDIKTAMIDVEADVVNNFHKVATDSVCSIIKAVYDLSLVVSEFREEETVSGYELSAELFREFIKYCSKAVTAYTEMYSIVYHAVFTCDQNVQDAKNTYDACNDKLNRLNDLQKKYTEIHDKPNQELDRKISILNEKIVELRETYEKLCEEADAKNEQDTSKYIDELNEVIKKIREFYDTYEHKEFLEPSGKQIDKMEEYVRGAVERKYPLRIPLYSGNKLSKEAKEVVRNDFIPKLSDIVDKHPDFIILAPKFDDESDDLFIYLTLREPIEDSEAKKNDDDPKGEKIQNETVGSELGYYIEREGRWYVAYDPDGNPLGNEDTYEEASYDIKQDIKEREEKANKNKPQNEAALTKAELDKLDDSDFGVREIRGYPLTDEDHIRKAIQFYSYCKSEYKDELARNITKKVIEKKLVGKVCITKENRFRDKFPEWMYEESKATMKVEGDTYKIFVDGKEVTHGTIAKKSEPINESIAFDPETGHTYM